MLTPETAEKRAIKDYLNAKGYFWWYNLQGLGAQKGLPDMFVYDSGKIRGRLEPQLIAIEVKTKKGKLSKNQKEFLHQLELREAIIIVGGIDEVMEVLQN